MLPVPEKPENTHAVNVLKIRTVLMSKGR